MDQFFDQLIEFTKNDKFLSAEMGLGLFELSGKLADPNLLNNEQKEIFYHWYCIYRKNAHYQLTPLEVAQKFQEDNFDKNISAIKDIFFSDDSSKYFSKTSGLAFEGDFHLPANQLKAGIFVSKSNRLFPTAATINDRQIAADKIEEQLKSENWIQHFYHNTFANISPIDQIIDLEDTIINSFVALDVEELNEMDITDAISDKENPQTILGKVKSKAKIFPDTADPFFLEIFAALQRELNVNPDEVKEIEKTAIPQADDQSAELMEQMLGQFSDPEQKAFYGDFFQFIQEKGVNQKTRDQKQLANQVGSLEKEWMGTPREALGGLTPEQYKEAHPGVEQTSAKTVKRDQPKVGRNDPCPCGSGKKYKKCHGKNA